MYIIAIYRLGSNWTKWRKAYDILSDAIQIVIAYSLQQLSSDITHSDYDLLIGKSDQFVWKNIYCHLSMRAKITCGTFWYSKWWTHNGINSNSCKTIFCFIFTNENGTILTQTRQGMAMNILYMKNSFYRNDNGQC